MLTNCSPKRSTANPPPQLGIRKSQSKGKRSVATLAEQTLVQNVTRAEQHYCRALFIANIRRFVPDQHLATDTVASVEQFANAGGTRGSLKSSDRTVKG